MKQLKRHVRHAVISEYRVFFRG